MLNISSVITTRQYRDWLIAEAKKLREQALGTKRESAEPSRRADLALADQLEAALHAKSEIEKLENERQALIADKGSELAMEIQQASKAVAAFAGRLEEAEHQDIAWNNELGALMTAAAMRGGAEPDAANSPHAAEITRLHAAVAEANRRLRSAKGRQADARAQNVALVKRIHSAHEALAAAERHYAKVLLDHLHLRWLAIKQFKPDLGQFGFRAAHEVKLDLDDSIYSEAMIDARKLFASTIQLGPGGAGPEVI